MKSICLFLFVLLAGFNSYSQGFTPPAPGKAVIYFTRVSSFGFAIGFEFFHQDKFIGDFKGKNYMRYESNPGEQLLWASSENKEFITADLKAGETYIVMVHVIMGGMKARVGLTPIPVNNEDFDRAVELIRKKKPVVTSQKTIKSRNDKLNSKGFISDKLLQYEREWKDTKNFKHISDEMIIPKNLLN